MSDIKTYPVIFNDDYTHDKKFKAGEDAELNQEQYDCAKKLSCGFDPAKPLITDTEKRFLNPETKTEVKPDVKKNA
jgi:hypothetical protein